MTARPTPPWRLSDLEERLAAEAPARLPLLRAYRDMDRLLHRTGFLPRRETLATRAAWWPLITVVGTDSPVGSAFLDRFRAPGTAGPALIVYGKPLSADPRLPADLVPAFPVHAAEAEALRGRVLADAGPEIPEALIERSDLVVVFAHAGHSDSGTDETAAVGASQSVGGGRLLTIHGESDVATLDARLDGVAAERSRRVAGLLASVADELENEQIPFVEAALARWRRSVRRGTLAWLLVLTAVFGAAVLLGGPENLPALGSWLLETRPALFGGVPVRLAVLATGTAGLWVAGRWLVRRAAARRTAAGLPVCLGEADLDPRRAFLKGIGPFGVGIAGWGRRARRRLAAIREAAAAV